MDDRINRLIDLADGVHSSAELARMTGLSRKKVGKILRAMNLPRLTCGARNGERNHMYLTGRSIDLDGYAIVLAPKGHPHMRRRKGRNTGIMYEHRLVVERSIGRYLEPSEVVDHIDGIQIHNSIDNLRIFQSNSEHLAATLTGVERGWSQIGIENIGTRTDLGLNLQPVDTYGLRKKRGDVRLRQILLAALKFGIDSPHLLGTHRWLEKAQIDYSSRSNLELALDDLSRRYEQDLARSR